MYHREDEIDAVNLLLAARGLPRISSGTPVYEIASRLKDVGIHNPREIESDLRAFGVAHVGYTLDRIMGYPPCNCPATNTPRNRPATSMQSPEADIGTQGEWNKDYGDKGKGEELETKLKHRPQCPATNTQSPEADIGTQWKEYGDKGKGGGK